MNPIDYYASNAFWEGNRADRLKDRVEALEDALDDAEVEIRAWRAMYLDAIKKATLR